MRVPFLDEIWSVFRYSRSNKTLFIKKNRIIFIFTRSILIVGVIGKFPVYQFYVYQKRFFVYRNSFCMCVDIFISLRFSNLQVC